MEEAPSIRKIRSAARILLICPDCGHENSEFAETLRGTGIFYCNGDACDYIFDLAPRQRRDFGKGFADACKRFYAAFYAMARSSTD
jgi:hypothetical protein